MHNITTKPIYERSERPMSVAVFLSGTGTNFDAIYEEMLNHITKGEEIVSIDLVFSNVPGCKGEIKAKERKLNTVSLSSSGFFKYLGRSPGDNELRIYYDAAVMSIMDEYCSPDIIVLAGYRRRLSNIFFKRFNNRIINMYPGDITRDYLITGVPAYKQALNSNESELRCSVYIQKEIDRFGPLITKSEPVSLEGFSNYDEEYANRIIRENAEWKILPYVIFELIAKGRVAVDDQDNVYIDGKKNQFN